MNLLPRRVRTRQQGPGLTEAEVELAKQALALPHAELDSVGLLDPRPTASYSSHRSTRIPASPGLARSTRLISWICFSLSRPGRPDRTPSVSPPRPSCL